MFQFRRFPAYCYFIHSTLTPYCGAGFPHSDIPGSKLMCSSPRLIAACHVLHRLLMPRHSPCALCSLTIDYWFVIFVLELCRHQQKLFYEIVIVTHLFFVYSRPVQDSLDSNVPQLKFPSCGPLRPRFSVALLVFLSFYLCSVFKVQLPA
jgi:hypothetical protein